MGTRDGEIMIKQIIRKCTYQAHLVESKIRQVLSEGDMVDVTIIRKKVLNEPMEDSLPKTGRMVSPKQSS